MVRRIHSGGAGRNQTAKVNDRGAGDAEDDLRVAFHARELDEHEVYLPIAAFRTRSCATSQAARNYTVWTARIPARKRNVDG
jgi:hypothetical protein